MAGHCKALVIQAQIPCEVFHSFIGKCLHDVVAFLFFTQLIVCFCHLHSTILPVIRYVIGRNHLLGVLQGCFSLIRLAFAYQLANELWEDTAVRITHTHSILINIDTFLINSTEFELVHQVVVHLFAIQLDTSLFSIKRSEAVSQTFLNEVVAHAKVVFRTYADCHVDRTFPIGFRQHFKHHQFALIEGAFTFQWNVHIVGDTVTRYHHTTAAYCFLVHLHHDAVCRNHLKVIILAAYPVFQDVLKFVRIFSEFFLHIHQCFRITVQCLLFSLSIEGVDALFIIRLYRDVFIGSFYILHTVPSDGQWRRVVGRTFHLVDVPVRLQVAEVAGTCIGTETFCLLIVP